MKTKLHIEIFIVKANRPSIEDVRTNCEKLTSYRLVREIFALVQLHFHPQAREVGGSGTATPLKFFSPSLDHLCLPWYLDLNI